MTSRNRLFNGTALGALAGTLLLATAAFAQDQSQSGSTPSSQNPTPSSQPSTAEPGTATQPGSTYQNTAQPTGAQSQQQMTSPQSSSQSTTMSASAGESLSKVKDAKTTLASASVQDSTGQSIGQVATVHTTKHGTPTTIDVTLQSTGGQAKTVAIKADKFKFDQSSNTLKSDLTSSEIQSLPSATGM